MVEVFSEMQVVFFNSLLIDLEIFFGEFWCDNIGQKDLDLWVIIEESVFQVLVQRFLIKRLSYIFCVLELDEDSNLFLMIFFRKFWKIVGSDKFKFIWWDEDGIYIVINEEFFKKEVLERKVFFRIFEIDSMKSLVR